jgi:putative acetyltransferase
VADAPAAGKPIIRAEQPDDRDEIARVVEAAFGSPTEARLVERIRSSPNFVPELSLIAELESRIVGHVMISFVDLHEDETTRSTASLSPLAVAPEFQGRGIGSALVRSVTARADERGEPLVVLEGSPVFYGRLGFEHSVPHGIEITLPSWAPAEAARILRLRNYDPSIRGRVIYPPAFDDVTEH